MLSLCLIEDNKKLWALLHQWLLDEGWRCDRYTSVEKLSEKHFVRYHVFLVDVMLPWENGYSFVKRIRERSDVWIIMLTAKGWIDDKKLWFTAWADDYLVKPFSLDELTMRIQALSTRLSDIAYYNYENIFIDWKSRLARKWDEVLHLTPIEWEVIWCLLAHKWVVASRADIIEHVRWADEMRWMSRSLDVTISHLRSKFSKDMINTIAWVGYQIA